MGGGCRNVVGMEGDAALKCIKCHLYENVAISHWQREFNNVSFLCGGRKMCVNISLIVTGEMFGRTGLDRLRAEECARVPCHCPIFISINPIKSPCD